MAGAMVVDISMLGSWKLQELVNFVKLSSRLATKAPTDLAFLTVSWYVSYPITIAFFIGILTAQGAPPSLQDIWMATLVATLIKPLGLLRTVEVMHWLGMVLLTQHIFFTVA